MDSSPSVRGDQPLQFVKPVLYYDDLTVRRSTSRGLQHYESLTVDRDVVVGVIIIAAFEVVVEQFPRRASRERRATRGDPHDIHGLAATKEQFVPALGPYRM